MKQGVFGLIREKQYGLNRFWHFGKCKAEAWENKKYNRNFPHYWPDGGRGYLLKREVIEQIFKIISASKNNFQLGNYIYEDVMLGELIGIGQTSYLWIDLLDKYLYDPSLSLNSKT